jgi:hypothetical protein
MQRGGGGEVAVKGAKLAVILGWSGSEGFLGSGNTDFELYVIYFSNFLVPLRFSCFFRFARLRFACDF